MTPVSTWATGPDPDLEIMIIGRSPPPPGAAGGEGAREPGRTPLQPRSRRPTGPRAQLAVSLLSAVMIIGAGLVAHAISSPGAGHDSQLDSVQVDVQQLRQLTRAEDQALVTADTEQLSTLLAADFTAVTVDQQVWTGSQLTRALGSGALDVRSFRIDEFGPEDPIEVRVDGDAAIVTYRADMEIASHPLRFHHDSAGAQRDRRLRTQHTDTWIRSDDTWKHLHAQTTAITRGAAGTSIR